MRVTVLLLVAIPTDVKLLNFTFPSETCFETCICQIQVGTEVEYYHDSSCASILVSYDSLFTDDSDCTHGQN